MSRSETDIQSAILGYLAILPDWWGGRINSGLLQDSRGVRRIRCAPVGTPDILGTYAGHSVGIEVKSAKGRQTDAQAAWQRGHEAAGGVYVLARSVDDVIAALEKLPRKGLDAGPPFGVVSP